MTDIQLFAFVILPIVVAGLGWAIVLINERVNARKTDPRR